MQNLNVGFIGAGNMASALAQGILNAQIVNAKNLFMIDKNLEKRDFWQAKGAGVFADAQDAFGLCDVIFLAIKPQGLKDFFAENKVALEQKILDINSQTTNHQTKNQSNKINEKEKKQNQTQAPLPFSKTNPLIISVLAGTSLQTLQEFFVNLPIVRVMPNLAATLGLGMSGACANSWTDKSAKDMSEKLLKASGACIWVKEEQINAVTAISGSGPAYFFYIFEIMQNAAQNLGFSLEEANQLVLQTALGATQLALVGDKTSAQLKEMVTSKGGTTFAALQTFQDKGLQQVLEQGIHSALNRAEELSKI